MFSGYERCECLVVMNAVYNTNTIDMFISTLLIKFTHRVNKIYFYIWVRKKQMQDRD